MTTSASFWEPCWACRLAGEPVGSIVAERGGVAVVLNPFALTAGHALVADQEASAQRLRAALLEQGSRPS